MKTLLVKMNSDGSCRAAFVQGGEVTRTIEADDVSDIYQILKDEGESLCEDLIPMYDL